MTATEQGTLLGSTCRKCGAAIPYCGKGRKRSLCDDCYPESFPTRKPLTNIPRARSGDPETSHQAAESITPGHVEERVLAMFALFAALTDDELCDQLPELYPPTVKTARSRLKDAGKLKRSAFKRPSNRGRLMIVWEMVR